MDDEVGLGRTGQLSPVHMELYLNKNIDENQTCSCATKSKEVRRARETA